MTKEQKILTGVGTVLLLGLVGGVSAAVVMDKKKRLFIYNQNLDAIVKGNPLQNGGKDSPFDTSLYKKTTGTAAATLSDADAATYADKIWKAKAPSLSNILTSDQQGVVAIFKQLRNKADVSKLSAFFFTNHTEDLFIYLGSFMDCSKDLLGDKTNYMDQINSIVASLS